MGHYLQESENTLLVFTVHIAAFKELEVWNKSVAWADIPVNATREMPRQIKGASQRRTGPCRNEVEDLTFVRSNMYLSTRNSGYVTDLPNILLDYVET